MKTYYKTDIGLKHTEEDNWENGCIPETSQTSGIMQIFKSDSIDTLIKDLMEFCATDDPENVLIDSCDEKGRIDIQVYENGDGYAATKGQMARFKEGKCRIWLAVYSFHVSRIVEEENLSIAELVTDKTIYSY